MNNNCIYTLHKKLCIYRYRLEVICGKYGLNDPRVLELSRKIDKITNEIQKSIAG